MEMKKLRWSGRVVVLLMCLIGLLGAENHVQRTCIIWYYAGTEAISFLFFLIRVTVGQGERGKIIESSVIVLKFCGPLVLMEGTIATFEIEDYVRIALVSLICFVCGFFFLKKRVEGPDKKRYRDGGNYAWLSVIPASGVIAARGLYKASPELFLLLIRILLEVAVYMLMFLAGFGWYRIIHFNENGKR